MTPSREHTRSNIGRLIASLLLLTMAGGIFVYRQEIIDQVAVWQYQPTAAISGIATQAQLSERGRFYLYASRPQIQDRTSFNASCNTAHSEATAVLGCYAQQRIYLFDVNDPRLDGIKEVTAAHEMLHAAYERLSPAERMRVDALLTTQAANITDPTFLALMQAYSVSEPTERLNELHSIIGTQIATLNPELETYYRQYFTDRSALVGLYGKYELVFSGLKSQQEALSNELMQLSTQISREVATYNQNVAQLNADVETFNRQAKTGELISQSEFTARRAALLARQYALTANREGLDVTISTYATKREQLAAINSQAEALNRSINSNLSPLPSI